MPNSTEEGVLNSRAQCNRVLRKTSAARHHRELIFKERTIEIRRVKDNGVKGVTVAGDFNQDISHKSIQDFMTENRSHEVY